MNYFEPEILPVLSLTFYFWKNIPSIFYFNWNEKVRCWSVHFITFYKLVFLGEQKCSLTNSSFSLNMFSSRNVLYCPPFYFYILINVSSKLKFYFSIFKFYTFNVCNKLMIIKKIYLALDMCKVKKTHFFLTILMFEFLSVASVKTRYTDYTI